MHCGAFLPPKEEGLKVSNIVSKEIDQQTPKRFHAVSQSLMN
jgi:hypothetical protein